MPSYFVLISLIILPVFYSVKVGAEEEIEVITREIIFEPYSKRPEKKRWFLSEVRDRLEKPRWRQLLIISRMK